MILYIEFMLSNYLLLFMSFIDIKFHKKIVKLNTKTNNKILNYMLLFILKYWNFQFFNHSITNT